MTVVTPGLRCILYTDTELDDVSFTGLDTALSYEETDVRLFGKPELMLAAARARWPRPLRTLGPPAIGQLWELRSFTWSPPLGDSVPGRAKN